MLKIYRLVFVILFFPATLNAQAKFQLELITPNKPFSMSVGDTTIIQFKALTSHGNYYYGVFLERADKPPWLNGSGPLTLEPLPLEQGLNTFRWDGESYGWAPSDAPEMGKLKKNKPQKYFFKILIFDKKTVSFLGLLANYHKQAIANLRSKNFTLN